MCAVPAVDRLVCVVSRPRSWEHLHRLKVRRTLHVRDGVPALPLESDTPNPRNPRMKIRKHNKLTLPVATRYSELTYAVALPQTTHRPNTNLNAFGNSMENGNTHGCLRIAPERCASCSAGQCGNATRSPGRSNPASSIPSRVVLC